MVARVTTAEADASESGDDGAISFGVYQVLPRLRLLTRRGERIELGRRAFEVLLALLDADGDALSKDELLSRVWAREVVNENNLQAQISALRRAFGPDREMISTVFNRGYRFALPNGTVKRRGTVRPEPFSPGLPPSLVPLIGRQSELDAISAALRANTVVTVTGTGGIGKSRVALELGRRLGASFRDGVSVVELSSLAGPGLVMSTVAATLRIGPGGQKLSEDIGPALRGKHVLLIMDGCEHLLEEVGEAIGRVLRNTTHLRVLATSQEPLGIEGEQVFRLPPLELPPARAESLDHVLRYASPQLLIQRLGAAENRLLLDEAQAQDICTICRRLDGIPLALELAAARVAQVGSHSVVQALSNRFALLTARRKTAIPRHQTLRATLEWSYALLTGEEQLFLQTLGVFAGSFTLAAAAAIARPGVADIWLVADLLAGLVAKSMVTKASDGSRARFRLSETVRAFALEKLAPTGDFERIAADHANYFRSRLARATDEQRQIPSDDWKTEFGEDLNDVRAALDWALSSSDDVTAGIQSLCASLPFWMQLSLLDESRHRVKRAIDRLAPILIDEPRLEMQLSAALGTTTAWARGPLPDARAALERTLQLATRLDDTEYRLQAHYGLWLHDLRSGRYAASLVSAEHLACEGRARTDDQAIMAGERAAGVSHHFLGSHATAAAMIRAAIKPRPRVKANFRLRFGIDQGVAALAFLARVEWLRGSTEEALDLARGAVKAGENLDHATSLCCALLEGGCTVAALAEDCSTLSRHAEAAISVADEHGLGFWRLYGQAFRALADLIGDPGEPSLERMTAIVNSIREIGFDLGYSVFASRLAEALGQHGRLNEARSLIDELLDNDAPSHWGSAELLRVKAALLRSTRGQNADQAASDCLDEALVLARRQGARAWETRIAHDLKVSGCHNSV